MKTRMNESLAEIKECYNLGFITPLEAICQTIDTLQAVCNEIEDKEEREAWEESVHNTMDNEHLRDALSDILEQWGGK